MNKERRKRIDEAMIHLDNIKEFIEEIQLEEEDAYDNLPEGLQYSERGEAMQEASDNLSSAARSVREAIDLLQTACGEY